MDLSHIHQLGGTWSEKLQCIELCESKNREVQKFGCDKRWE